MWILVKEFYEMTRLEGYSLVSAHDTKEQAEEAKKAEQAKIPPCPPPPSLEEEEEASAETYDQWVSKYGEMVFEIKEVPKS